MIYFKYIIKDMNLLSYAFMLKVIAKTLLVVLKNIVSYSYIVYIKGKTISNKNLFLGYEIEIEI